MDILLLKLMLWRNTKSLDAIPEEVRSKFLDTIDRYLDWSFMEYISLDILKTLRLWPRLHRMFDIDTPEAGARIIQKWMALTSSQRTRCVHTI